MHRLASAPRGRGEAVVRGLLGGGLLAGLCGLVALGARLAGGDAAAALGNAALLVGMATLGLTAALGRPRLSRWSSYGRGGEEGRRRAGPAPARQLVRLSLGVAGAVPFLLFVVLATTR